MNTRTFILSILLTLGAVCLVNAMPLHPDALARLKSDPVAFDQYINRMRDTHARGIDAPRQVEWSRAADEPDTVRFPVIFLFVDFPDQPARTPAAFYDSLFFSLNGSLRAYYREISYGNFDITTFDLPSSIGWLRMPHPYSYYVGTNQGMGAYPNNSQGLTEDAVRAADPLVNFYPYATNIEHGDESVTALFIVHSGSGYELTLDPTQIHSHASSLMMAPSVDGVDIRTYSTEPELWNLPLDMTCGVFAHEMGHSVFGCPDLYDIDYTSEGLGEWSLMSSGSWGGGLGNLPTHPDPYCRIRMGFLAPITVTGTLIQQSIPPIERQPIAYKLQGNNPANPLEYFLVENRQKCGFDTSMIGSGLLVYHVDETVYDNEEEWYPGHSTSGYYKVALEQADNQYHLERNLNYWDTGDPYPGSTENLNFTPFSQPSSRYYTGASSAVSIANVFARNDTMVATLSKTTDTSRHLTLTYPNNRVSLPANIPFTIRWTRSNYTGGVNVLWKRTPQSRWDTLFANLTGGDTIVWTPSLQTDSARIRIVSSDGLLDDQSDNTFAIHRFAIVHPNGGEVWGIDSLRSIVWDTTGYTGLVTIEWNRYYPDSSWTPIATNQANGGTYLWMVPNQSTSRARIRLRNEAGVTIALSETDFSISQLVQRSITLLSPNGGEQWNVNSIHTIRWNCVGYSGHVSVSIQRSSGALWTRVYYSLSNSDSVSWRVTGPTGNSIRLLVRGVDSVVADISDNVFTILPPLPSLTLVSPNGGEVWGNTSLHTIRWTSVSYTDSVNIMLRQSPAMAWERIFALIPNTGSVEWGHGMASDSALMGIYNRDSSLVDTSDSYFVLQDIGAPEPTMPIPTRFTIDQLHPNPFNNKLTIRYGIPKTAPVTLTIYDVMGRMVLHSALGTQPAGYHGFQWNPTKVSSGLYIIQLDAGGSSTFAKAALLK